MNKEVYETLGNLLVDTGNKIKAGNCVVEEEQAMEAMSMIAHIPVSKETASSALNMSTSKFDDNVRLNKIPKGRKNRGFKELRWYVDEIVKDKLRLPSIIRRLHI
jgi:hypothetical protein